MNLYGSLRPWFFRLDPETAHEGSLRALALADALPAGREVLKALFTHRDPSLETEVAGLRFPNPVGLAAGFDKDCRVPCALAALGFGFVEVGTLTARPQPGNPKPRLFRLPASRALVNRMGFNNPGAEAAAARLARMGPHPVPVGVNIGLNKDADREKAAEEYARCFEVLYPHGDYFAVNVSSPNTDGLRRLQERLRLERILTALQDRNPDGKPVFVKLSPDLEDRELEELLPLLQEKAAGVVCTNTTVSRAGLPEEAACLQGGLSGAPLKDLSTRMIREVYRRTRGRLPIIGVGGIASAEDAYQKLRAGASLVQVYTGFVYGGPSTASELCRGVARILREHGLSRVGEAVGKSHPESVKVA